MDCAKLQCVQTMEAEIAGVSGFRIACCYLAINSDIKQIKALIAAATGYPVHWGQGEDLRDGRVPFRSYQLRFQKVDPSKAAA